MEGTVIFIRMSVAGRIFLLTVGEHQRAVDAFYNLAQRQLGRIDRQFITAFGAFEGIKRCRPR